MFRGEYLKRERVNKGISQEELGRKVGLTKASISRIESGTQDPPASILADIANVVGCSPLDFFKDEVSKKEDVYSFWNRVKSMCKKREIGQKDLYEAAGLDPKVAFHWSNVCVLPSPDAVLKFAAYLEVDVYRLFYGDEIPNAQTMRTLLEEKKPLAIKKAWETIEALQKELAELKGKGDN